MSEDLRSKIRKIYEQAYNQENLDILDDIIAVDYVRHQPPMETVRGIADYKTFIRDVRSAYSGFSMTVDDIIVDRDNNTSAIRLTLRGKHTGQAPTLQAPPTGKDVEMKCCTISYWDKGKVLTEYAYNDYLGLVQQFGVIPPPGLY